MSAGMYTPPDPDHPYRDPRHPGNSAVYHSGRRCVEAGCIEPAGTQWSSLWCAAHNVQRMDRINEQFDRLRETIP